MADAAALHQMEQFFSKVLGVISGTLEGLGHQQHGSAVIAAAALAAFQMTAKNSAAELVYLRVGLDYPGGGGKIAAQKALMHGLQHLLQHIGHGNQVAAVIAQQAHWKILQAHRHRAGEIADALQINDELKASQQLARLSFRNFSDGAGNLLIHPALHAVQFFFAVFDRNEGHVRGILDEVTQVVSRVFGDQAALQHQPGQFAGRTGFLRALAFHASPAETVTGYYRNMIPPEGLRDHEDPVKRAEATLTRGCAGGVLDGHCRPISLFCTTRAALSARIPLLATFLLPSENELPDNTSGSAFFNQVHRYSRADLLRILRLTARQLASWEKAELVAAADSYSFFDLLQVKKVRDLCARKVRPAMIRQSLEAMQKQAAGMENPLLEAGVFTTGHRVAFRHAGKVLEPIAGQFMFDFSPEEKVVASTPVAAANPDRSAPDVSDLFARGIALEEDPANQVQAISAYERVLELDPEHAAAHINLGTLHYNRQEYQLAEDHYRHAIEIDPRYALAYFDLGNVLDETSRVTEAIQAYHAALQLAPTYADAHYNLALAYEKVKQPRMALKHWRAYVKLDTTGPWAMHARNQAQRILQADSLKVVYTRKHS